MAKHIEDFQKLNIRVNDIPKKQRIDVFIGTLKDKYQPKIEGKKIGKSGRNKANS